jgi:hypothetical protein
MENLYRSPAQAGPCGLASKLQTQNSSSQSDARHIILILMKENLYISPAQARPCGLAS